MPNQNNCAYFVSRNAQIYPDREAVISERARVTYKNLDERSNYIENLLLENNVQKGDRICIMLYNDVEFAEILEGTWKTGAIAVPINYRLSLKELNYIINDCSPKAIFFDYEFYSIIKELSIDTKTLKISVPEKYEDFNLEEFSSIPVMDIEVSEYDIAEILYTAGTTGNPKGVMLTHKNLFYQTINSWSLGIDPKAKGLVVLPLFHAGGLNGCLLPILHIGACSYLLRKFDPLKILEIIEKEKINGMVGVPVMYDLMANLPQFHTTDFSSVLAFICGGAPLSDATIKKYAEKNLRFTQGYGLTETSPGATGMTPDEFELKRGSAGRGLLWTLVEIIDENGFISSMPDVKGEIIVKGPNVMKGYWNNEKETQKVLKDGWLYTGDIGKFDKDGYLYICGRKKEMIISGGENIYPMEIENALLNLGYIIDTAVIGVSDEKWGEVPVAFVVSAKEISEEQVKEDLKKILGGYKIPKRIIFKKFLPRNQAGKILKNELKKEIGG